MTEHKSIAAALAAAQGEVKPAAKNATNPHLKNRYANEESIIEAYRPVLSKYGLAITKTIEHTPTGYAMVARLIHAASGEEIKSICPLIVGQGNNPMQQLGSATTYASRYVLRNLLNLATGEGDDDGASLDNASHTSPSTRFQSPPKQKTGVISQPQQKRLFAIAKQAQVPEDALKRIITDIAHVDSSRDIPWQKYEAVCKAVEDYGQGGNDGMA